MKHRILVVILAGPLLFGLPIHHSLLGQTCSDDEGMVNSYVKSITDLASTVKKESLDDFEKDYHERSCLSRLTLSLGILNSLMDCLNKAAKDTTATKEQIVAIQSKLHSYAKLKSELERDQGTLKAAKNPKAAKSVIEHFVIAS